MNKWISRVLAITIALSFSSLAIAGEHGWVTSIARAVPQDQVYRVNIQRIDDKQPIDARQYRVDAGEHKIRVSLILEPQFAPKLDRITHREIYAKTVTVDVKDGKRYEIGGKVDPDASDEAQRDGSFWEPIVYREK